MSGSVRRRALDWLEILSSATVAILAVWLGATVISRAPNVPTARLFALMAAVLALWAGSHAVGPYADPDAQPFFGSVRYAAAYLLPPLLAHLVASFTSRDGVARLAVLSIGYAAALPLAVRAFTNPDRPFHVDPPHYSLPGIAGEVFGWAWIAVRLMLLAAAAWWAWQNMAHVRADASRVRQAGSVLASVITGAGGAVLLILPAAWRPPVWVGMSLVGVALVCATYAVVAQRVFLAPDVARRAVSSTLAGGLAVTAMILVLVGVDTLADDALGVGMPIVTAVVLALSLAVYEPAQLAWRRIMRAVGRDRGAALVIDTGADELAAQHADASIRPALDRLVWRFGLGGAKVCTSAGRVLAQVGLVDEPALALPLVVGSTRFGELSVAPGSPDASFSAAERLVLEQTADFVAAALELGERQRQHASERTALADERQAQERRATALAAAVDSDAVPDLRIYALGPLRAQLDGEALAQWGGRKAGSRQAEGCFAFLFDRGERGVAKDEFLDLVWPDVPIDRADMAFHRTMNGLRATLTPAGATIRFFNDRYHLQLADGTWTDVAAFENALRDASQSSSADLTHLLEARSLYRGDYLDDCPFYGDSAEVEERRAELRQRFVDLLVDLGSRFEVAGDRPAAAEAFRRALAVSPEGCPPAADGLVRLGASTMTRAEG